MLDLGWTELMVIGVVALIVVGPKDLPGMFRTVGNFIGKARRMAREFSQAMNDAADDAGVSDVKRTLNAASNPMKSAMDEVKKSTDSFTKATMESGKPKEAGKEAGKPKLSPERQEAADKIRERSAEVARERQAKEKAEQAVKTDTVQKAEDKGPASGTETAAPSPAAESKAVETPSKTSPATKASEDKA